MALRPPKLNGNQFRANQADKLAASGLVTRFADSAIARLDGALQAAFEDNLPVGSEITRTYSTLEPGAVFSIPGSPEQITATPALAAVVLDGVKDAITTEFNRRGFTVSFSDTLVPGPFHYMTIA